MQSIQSMRSPCTQAGLPQNYGGILIAKIQSRARLRRRTGTPGKTLSKGQRRPFGAQRPRHGMAKAAGTAKTAARAVRVHITREVSGFPELLVMHPGRMIKRLRRSCGRQARMSCKGSCRSPWCGSPLFGMIVCMALFFNVWSHLAYSEPDA